MIQKMPHYGHSLRNRHWGEIIRTVYNKLNEIIEYINLDKPMNNQLKECREKNRMYASIIDHAIKLLQGATWQSMNDKFIAYNVIEILKLKVE